MVIGYSRLTGDGRRSAQDAPARRGRLRRWRVVLLATVAALASVMVLQGPAYAVGCTGTGCKGKNPQTNGCGADARNLHEITYGGVRVELRYSQACGAAWARGTITSDSKILGTRVAIAGYSCSAANDGCWKGHYRSATILEQGEQAYTSMWPFGDYVRACKVYDDFDGAPNRRYGACTTRH